MFKKLMTVLPLIVSLAPLWSDAQIWKQTEEEPQPLWRLKGSFNLDFYPYGQLNSERYYNSNWQFNYTTGVELLHTTDQKPTSWGGGLLYSVKDFNQNIKQSISNIDSSAIQGDPVENVRHKIRYTELYATFEYELLNEEETQIFADGGLQVGFRETAVSFKSSSSRKDTIFINDRQFGRFLLGVHYGVGFRLSLDEQLSLETGLNGRLYTNDLGKSQYVNFSSFSLRLKLVYEFTNEMAAGEAE